MGLTCAITSDRPRAIIIMPSVAINGGTFMREMTMPLTKPASAPVKSPTMTPTQTGMPMLVTATPVITAASVMTVPTERSMPPVMMTKVTPSASTPLTAVASRMPMTLSKVKKVGRQNREDDKENDKSGKRQQFLRCI